MTSKELDRWLAIHTKAHEKVLTLGCPYCTCRAINAIEGFSRMDSIARKFLDRVGNEAVLKDVRQLRIAIGQDAFAWMLKPEYR